jgi:hypothetical protein
MSNKYLGLLLPVLGIFSCKIGVNPDRLAANADPSKVYRLMLEPPAGSKYYFKVSSRSDYHFTAGDKKIDNLSKVDAFVYYTFSRDSAGDYVINVQYDKVHVYSKNGDEESDLDAANAGSSGDAVEQLLGGLRTANIVAVVSPSGQVRSVSGFKEMYDRYVSQSATANPYQLNAVKERWNHTVGDELVNKNMEQLFRIFPDSAVHVGDKWQLGAGGGRGELGLKTINSFTLTEIRDNTAFIESEGAITSDSAATPFMGNNVTTNLKGKQSGEYQLDTKTGMVVSATVKVNVEGTLEAMGREIPLSLETTVKIERQKLP